MMLEDFKIQWFPGHMTKAKRMMESQIKLVDVVVEMLDARIPRSSTNPMLQDILGSKPRLMCGWKKSSAAVCLCARLTALPVKALSSLSVQFSWLPSR